MRLIDADELKIEFEDCMFNDNMMNPLMRYTDILETIDNQPTVYNIDKVVEELEKQKNMIALGVSDSYWYREAIEDAIEIVKAGVKYE